MGNDCIARKQNLRVGDVVWVRAGAKVTCTTCGYPFETDVDFKAIYLGHSHHCSERTDLFAYLRYKPVCPSCKTTLLTAHVFCPDGGGGLADQLFSNVEVEREPAKL